MIPPATGLRIALYGFALNAVWEFAHAGTLYDMWTEVHLLEGLFHITLAIVGDVVIVLGIALAACWCVGPHRVLPPDWRGWLALLGIGLTAGIGLEWIAKALDWWTYNNRMPVLHLFDYTVGLSPVAQIAILPALSVFLGASRQDKTSAS